MKKQDSVYKKSDSILELRGSPLLRSAALERVASVCRKQGAGRRDEDVLTLACNDLLGETTEPVFFLRDHVVEEIARLRDEELERYLRYRYAYEVYPVERIVRDYPPLVQIEPASVCNYRCVFCYQTNKKLTSRKNGHMGMMSIELFRNVVDQLENHVEALTIASRGEPSVNKKLPDMLRYLSGKFLAVKVNTNASLLDDDLSHALLDSDTQTLVFSADAASEPLYSKLRVNGNFEKVVRNIRNFNEIREKHYPSSRLITRVSGVSYSDEQDVDEAEQFWSDLADQVMFVKYNPWENVYDLDSNLVSTPCSDLWRRMFVWWDGRVNPCDVDYLTTLSTESMLNRGISEIWRGEMYETLRKKHLQGKRGTVQPCSKCTFV